MKIPIDLTFLGMDSSEAITLRIEERVARLAQFGSRISKCRIVVEAPHRRGRKGRLYRVHVDIHVPGKVFAVRKGEDELPEHEHLEEALDNAFDAGERLLRDRNERQNEHRG